jgi:hypothetical protein
MEKSYPNEIYAENVEQTTPRSSMTYDELNDLTLTPNKKEHDTTLEKISSMRTEKFDVEHGGLHDVEPVKTSKYNCIHT